MGGGDDTGAQQLAAGFNMGKGLAGQPPVPVDSNVMENCCRKREDTGATRSDSGLAGALSMSNALHGPEEQAKEPICPANRD